MAEDIQRLRTWARTRTRAASDAPSPAVRPAGEA
jgi:hypothetical protein